MTLAILCLAALAIVACAVSAGVALALWLLQRPIEGLAPMARARVYLLGAWLPCLASVAVLVAALAPSFGWIADHCGLLGDPHLHPHICAHHHAAAGVPLALSALALVLVLRVGAALGGRARALVLGARARRALDQISLPGDSAQLRLLPVDEPQAFVLGLLRPTLYVTRGLSSGSASCHLQAVLAHERAHLARRDPLRRFLSGIALSFHLPCIAGWIGRCQATAQEMAADDVAARAVGSRESVAQALVALARARCQVAAVGAAFTGSDVEVRVSQLLDATVRRDSPRPGTLVALAGLMVVALAASADAVHHGVELVLGALGS